MENTVKSRNFDEMIFCDFKCLENVGEFNITMSTLITCNQGLK